MGLYCKGTGDSQDRYHASGADDRSPGRMLAEFGSLSSADELKIHNGADNA
ncbi:MAG: hypothetical protein U5K71_03500 [Gracilimonas sp.]|nr:hypothetical protein [Gracilimonas sp.]